MDIKTFKLSELILDPNNARKHNPKNIEVIKASLARFGQRKNVVIDQNKIVLAGNGTVEAARALGWQEIQADQIELSAIDRTAYALADNRSAELAEWKTDVLIGQLKDLDNLDFDIGEIGFDLADFDSEIKPGLIDDDEVPEVTETRCKIGDLWILGEHRLMCGDSTNVQHVERLMDGEKADMVFTDPPYNIAYKGGSKKRKEISNDDMGDGFADFMRAIYANLWVSTAPGAAVYVCHADTERVAFTKTFLEVGFHLSSIIIWVKNNATFGRQDYFWKHEPILYGWNSGGSHKWYGPNNEETIWNIDRPSKSEEHPTMKPVDLIERALRNSSQLDHTVLDLFLGSGSTLIACEKTNRRCFGMEIDLHYCDVILSRWEKFTGKKAELHGNA